MTLGWQGSFFNILGAGSAKPTNERNSVMGYFIFSRRETHKEKKIMDKKAQNERTPKGNS